MKTKMDDAVEDLLRVCRTQIRDLVNGWPVKELHEPPEFTIAKINTLLGDEED